MKQKLLAILAAVLLLTAEALAAGGLELKSLAEIEVSVKTAKGETELRRVEAAKANVAPGDAVIFTTRYLNKGDKPATGVVLTNPIPEHMLYLDGSAEGSGTRIDFSVDGGRSYGDPGKLTVKEADGRQRPAVAADYTQIRWTLAGAVAPAAAGSVSFRAKVK